ncbi:glycosyltransferase [Paenibacillaceae bacterium]|nr:glycosyltransferase [Paenibacillaceae bacterium]
MSNCVSRWGKRPEKPCSLMTGRRSPNVMWPSTSRFTGRKRSRGGQCMNTAAQPKIVGFATQGHGGDDERRLKALLSGLSVQYYPFEKRKKHRNLWAIMRYLKSERPELVVMEGTGVFGGLALILSSYLVKTRYVISSGDSVGPFVAQHVPALGPLFHWYEKLLYRRSIGFIGWTPYLTGRALTYGSKYGMTAAGWAPFTLEESARSAAKKRIRDRYGIAEEQLVIGIVGSLNWNTKVGYCYGYELVQAMQRVLRKDVTILIVGDGSGQGRLEQLAGDKNIIFTGRVKREEVPEYLAAMDAASLPQSVDQVGSFRYTTKISEYLAAGLPVITGTIPMAYDLRGDWLIRIAGNSPWSEKYVGQLAEFIDGISIEALREQAVRVPRQLPQFDKEQQISSVGAFIGDIVYDIRGG